MTEESSLARAMLDQMSTDISGNLGGYDPLQITSDSSPTGQPRRRVRPPMRRRRRRATFNLGVSGTDSCSDPVDEPGPAGAGRVRQAEGRFEPAFAPVSDIRRISYWFVSDSANGGLAKQEVTSATGADLATTPPDVENASSLIIAPEVKNVHFEYFDGTDWQSSWDGTTMPGDGMTPIGPPAAIRITLTLRSRDGLHTTDYQHVVALPGGNNFAAQKSGL